MNPPMPEEWNSLLLLLKQVGWAGAVGAGAMGYALKEVFKSRDSLVDRLVIHLRSIEEDRIREQEQYAKSLEVLYDAHEAHLKQIYDQQIERECKLGNTSRYMIDVLAEAISTLSDIRKEKSDGSGG